MKKLYILLLGVALMVVVPMSEGWAQSIRKNYTEMTQAERDALVQAYYDLRRPENNDLINEIANFHNNNFEDIHFNTLITDNIENDVFLPWHRYASYEVEQAMQDLNPYVSLPYWDWRVNRSTSDLLWSQGFLGQFNSAWNLGRNLGGGALPTGSNVSTIQNISNFQRYTSDLEHGIVHTGGHNWTGGIMARGNSPLDPVFYFHHNMVDKLWQEWEEREGSSSFDRTNMPRYNINPNSITDSRSLGIFYAENRLAVLDRYTVQNRTLGTELFYYQYVIRAENSFVVPSGRTARFESGREIVLRSGFEARNGSNFVARIDTDRNFNSSARKAPIAVVRKPYIDLQNVAVLQNAYNLEESLLSESNHSGLILYPNPAVNMATIVYDAPKDNKFVSLKLFDLAGNEVATLIDHQGSQEVKQEISFDVSHMPNGLYYCKLQIGDKLKVQKFVINK